MVSLLRLHRLFVVLLFCNSTMRVELVDHFKPCVTDIYL